MISKKSAMTAAVSSLLAVGTLSLSSQARADDMKSGDTMMAKGECHGVNACKGKGECGSKGHSCAGKNSCKGKGWIHSDKETCTKLGGKYKGDKGGSKK